MEKFVASNGRTITRSEIGSLFIYGQQGRNLLENFDYLSKGDIDALREFFQHERDAELGRWRDPEAPEWVAYQPPECADYDLVIVCETSGESCHYYRADDDGHKAGHPWENLFVRTARRYFAAHPEPKPWDSPEPGDVWVLTVEGQTETWKWNSTGQFTRLRDGTPLYDYQRDHVTDARRIWPEVSGE